MDSSGFSLLHYLFLLFQHFDSVLVVRGFTAPELLNCQISLATAKTHVFQLSIELQMFLYKKILLKYTAFSNPTGLSDWI